MHSIAEQAQFNVVAKSSTSLSLRVSLV